MSESISQWIEPRRVVESLGSNPTHTSTTLNGTSSTHTRFSNDRVLLPRITPEIAAYSSSSSDICVITPRDSSGVELLAESPIPDGNEARGHSGLRKVQRQSHTKSRTGCFSCKRRRIKCEENRPSCTQCLKRRLKCEWPDLQFRDVRAAEQVGFSSSSVPAQLSSAEANFTMQDFRLFNHFIQNAYPHHPIGNDSVWTHEIVSISHNYDYLLHAMLGLSASDLTSKATKTAELSYSAMAHRLQAIKSLNQALSNGFRTCEEGNAMLATCYVLLFQSVLLYDGLPEYMSFIRGCVLIAQSMGCRRMKFLFHSFFGQESLKMMDPHLKETPEVNPRPVGEGDKSLEAFESLCERDYEKKFHAALLKTTRALYTSSRDAYLGLMDMYANFAYVMRHEEFQHFIDPTNVVGQLLQAHFVAVQLLLTPISIHELGDRKPEKPSNESSRWLDAILERVTPQTRHFFEWPMSVAEGIQTGAFYEALSYDQRPTSDEEDEMNLAGCG